MCCILSFMCHEWDSILLTTLLLFLSNLKCTRLHIVCFRHKTCMFLVIFLFPGWNHVVWVRQTGSVPSGLQASLFPVGGCSAAQSSVPLWPGVCVLVLRWKGAIQNLQVHMFVICIPSYVTVWTCCILLHTIVLKKFLPGRMTCQQKSPFF